MDCAVIDCDIGMTDFGKIVNFRKGFSCISYFDHTGGSGGLMLSKDHDFIFHFTATQSHILLYPVHNRDYKPIAFVEFFELIQKKIDKSARLFMWNEYQEVKKREEKDYQEYKEQKERERFNDE